MRKKRENCSAPEHTKLKIPLDFQSNDGNIQSLIEELRNTDSFEVQQQVVTKLAAYLKNESSSDNQQLILKLITYIFLIANSKFPIKKTIVRSLLHADSCQIESCLAYHLQCFMKSIKDGDQIDVLKNSNNLCNYILSCTENYAPGLRALSSIAGELFNFVFDFLTQLVLYLTTNEISIVQIKTNIYCYIHNTIRVLLFLVQKCCVDQNLPQFSLDIIKLCYSILSNKAIAFDTKKNCGIIMVYTFNFLNADITQDFIFKSNPALELLTCGSHNGCNIETLGIENYCNDHTVKLALYCGILNVIPRTVLLSETINEVPVIAYLFREVICCVKLTTSIPTQMLEVSHALTLLSRSLDKMPFETLQPLFKEGLNYVWTHLDHNVDTVRHMTKSVFKNFVQLANLHKQEDNDSLLKSIFDDINALPFSAVSRYIALYLLASEISCSSLLLNMKLLLPQQMLVNIKDPSIAPQICTLYEYLMEKHFVELTPQYEEVWILQWVKIILPYLKESHTATNFYQRLLISAFKINPLILKIIMQYQFNSTPAEFGALLGCLRVARKNGVQVNLNDCSSCEAQSYWKNLIEYKTLEVNMFHQHDEIRISVLALVVESQKSTEIFTEWELKFLRRHLYYNITAQIASTRKEFVHFFKKAFTRISEGLAVLNRNIENEAKHKRQQQSVEQCEIDNVCKMITSLSMNDATKNRSLYISFLKHIVRECLLPGLLNDANFARRSATLELLLFFHDTFNAENWKDLWFDEDIFNLKYTVIFDGYESNKQMAVNLLRRFASGKLQTSKARTVQDLNNTLALASDLKPSNTIAAAYMFEVCLLSPYILDAIQELVDLKENKTANPLHNLLLMLLKELYNKLTMSKENSLQVDKSFNSYGIVFTIRHLFAKINLVDDSAFWRNVLSNHLIDICFKIYDHAGPIVTNPSPEGNLPDEYEILEDDEIGESTKAQALLVFAWRNVKEVALLLGDIAAKVAACDDKVKLVEDEMLLKIGAFFIDLFLRTKHRGVFEQAYLGFYKLCEGFWRSNNVKLKGLPELWLSRMLDILSGNVNEASDTLCATRRSAGLPFLILATLTTEPVSRANKSFHFCIKILLNMASDVSQENSERRTHCINVLRAIFRNNQLGELVSQYVGRGMIVAIIGLKSTIWGVRNSATLLFAALVTRIFGVQRTRNYDSLSSKNKMTVKVFFMRYPELHEFLLNELSASCKDSTSHALYPLLLILSRLYPSNLDATELNLKEYLPLISKCLSHTMYRTRELAAQASVPFISYSGCDEHIIYLLILLSNVNLRNNEMHGLLLQLLYLLKKHQKRNLNINFARLCEPTFWILMCTGKQVSYLNAALYIEVLVLLIPLMFKEKVMEHQTFRTLLEMVEWQVKNSAQHIKFATGDYAVNLHYLKMYLLATVVEYHNLLALYTADDILLNLFKASMTVRAFYLKLIVYLNFERPNYSKHCLYVSEDLDISKKEYSVVLAFKKEFRKQLRKHLHINLKDVFMAELVNFLNNSECRLPALLVLRYYPCIMNAVFPINCLLRLTNCDSEECVSAVISCVSSFLRKLKVETLKELNYDMLIECLKDSCSPTAAVHRRLAVCDFLLDNKIMFCTREVSLSTKVLCDVWNMILVLLEDDDPSVRNSISKLNTRTEKTTKIPAKVGLDIISDRAREELLLTCMSILPSKDAIKFLVKWSLRHKPDHIDNDMSVVFTRGYHNLYVETTPVVKVTVKLLKDLLWSLEDGLNYDDKSIFIEEKALMVTNTLLNAIKTAASVMSKNTHTALWSILKAAMEFLEGYPINKPSFKADFRKILTKEQTNGTLMKALSKNDFNTLRLFLWTVYSPLLSS